MARTLTFEVRDRNGETVYAGLRSECLDLMERRSYDGHKDDLVVLTPDPITKLYVRLRRDVEDSDGGWNGGDTVEVLCEWFKEHGFDVDSPNPWGEDDE